MIVDTMTLGEVARYLLLNVFDNRPHINLIEKKIAPLLPKYKQAIGAWRFNPTRSKGGGDRVKVFKPIIVSSPLPHSLPGEKLFIIPTSSSTTDFKFATTCGYIFTWRGKKYIATRIKESGSKERFIRFYTWHSLERWMERWEGNLEDSLTLEKACEIIGRNCDVVFNCGEGKNGKDDDRERLFASWDGSWLGIMEWQERYMVLATFISEEEYYERQEEIWNDCSKDLEELYK